MKKKWLLIFSAILVVFLMILHILYVFNYIPHKQYTNDDFQIKQYRSSIDQDQDGIDDQTDILDSARDYIATNPNYKSQYYTTGYPDDGFGVCTDVVAFALKGAGYDLMQLVNTHIQESSAFYQIAEIDENIDFRRVKNLNIYFAHTAIALTTDINQIEEWQGGDIVVFEKHIGVVSDKRNKNGVAFVLHHANPYQSDYEEDILEYRKDIVAHYRISM